MLYVAMEELLAGLVRVVDGSSSNSTMKWVLLWSLLDAAPLLADQEKLGLMLPLAPVARSAKRVLKPQLQKYGDRDVLRQVNRADTNPALYQEGTPEADVAWILAQWPVPRLQLVGGVVHEVLWRVPADWEQRIRNSKTRNKPLPRSMFRTDGYGLPVVEALPGVAEGLARLAPLLKPAVETRWRDEIRARNQFLVRDVDPDTRLDNFLFPNSRKAFPAGLKQGLLRLQQHACFWCLRPTGETVVDHVIPWSYTHNDAIENLVITHTSCNEVKSDLPLSAALRQRWYRHLEDHREDLKALAASTSTVSDLDLSLAWARNADLLLAGQVLTYDVVDSLPVRIRVPAGTRTPDRPVTPPSDPIGRV